MDAPVHTQPAPRFHIIDVLQLASEESDPTFDGVARLASRVVGTPIGLVTFVGEFRQWLRGRFGYARAYTELIEAFCVQAMDSPKLLEVRDAMLDPRFANNPLVTGPPFHPLLRWPAHRVRRHRSRHGLHARYRATPA